MSKETFCKLKYVRISPSKIRRVADVIRGKNVSEAMALIRNMPHQGARILEKVLKSAVANATHNDKAELSALIVSTLLVNEGPSTSRFQPRARGRIYRIIKRTSHVNLAVSEAKQVKG